MSCSSAVIYSVYKPDISETFKSEPVYALPAIYLQSIHNSEYERNLLHLHTAGSYLSLSECSLSIQLLCIVLHCVYSIVYCTPYMHCCVLNSIYVFHRSDPLCISLLMCFALCLYLTPNIMCILFYHMYYVLPCIVMYWVFLTRHNIS